MASAAGGGLGAHESPAQIPAGTRQRTRHAGGVRRAAVAARVARRRARRHDARLARGAQPPCAVRAPSRGAHRAGPLAPAHHRERRAAHARRARGGHAGAARQAPVAPQGHAARACRCARDRRQLLARLRALHGACARLAVDPPVRRRRIRARRDPGAGGRGARAHLRALPPQPHGLPAAQLRHLRAGLRRAARRRRGESQPAGDRALPAQGRGVLHPPHAARGYAVCDRAHEVSGHHHGARAPDRVLHRRGPQPHRAAAAAQDRDAVDDGARFPARAGAPGGVHPGVLRLRASGGGPHLPGRALRAAQGERERARAA